VRNRYVITSAKGDRTYHIESVTIIKCHSHSILKSIYSKMILSASMQTPDRGSYFLSEIRLGILIVVERKNLLTSIIHDYKMLLSLVIKGIPWALYQHFTATPHALNKIIKSKVGFNILMFFLNNKGSRKILVCFPQKNRNITDITI